MHVETKFEGWLFKVEVLSFKDEHGRELKKEVVRHPGAVLVIGELEGGKLAMIRNERVAVGERLWEFPAGKLEPGEEALKAAHRELEEETGYRAGSMRKLGEFYTSPGFTDELMRVFLATDLTFVGQRLEAGEEIEVEVVSFSEARSMVCDGRLRDGKSVAGLLMYQNQQQECPA
ncbi:MAG: NUDIX hydrolase [Phycisphaerales bacterium]|nr:NUDIX hydrolase [Phycisphaerales bacterium]MCI0629526.1 NUDIX hydrolase [Phycisphaerales bacterium]MCI0674276.1 NUDIX hydrolase [Phycisphaerales bacterium]